MRIVVDTSVIVAVVANEPEKSALIASTKGAEIVVPWTNSVLCWYWTKDFLKLHARRG